WVNAMFHSIERCRTPSFARAIGIPVLMIAASDERVVRNDAQIRLAQAMPSCRRVEIAGARHEILKESDSVRRRFWAEFDAFVGPG
ncbi:MAG: alpha/beta hydrolase, partial [Alphaproteobacteria bacterium]|nr:alpha/beta hydrolase [Alphaproteobacteria bacterium]